MIPSTELIDLALKQLTAKPRKRFPAMFLFALGLSILFAAMGWMFWSGFWASVVAFRLNRALLKWCVRKAMLSGIKRFPRR